MTGSVSSKTSYLLRGCDEHGSECMLMASLISDEHGSECMLMASLIR